LLNIKDQGRGLKVNVAQRIFGFFLQCILRV